MATVVVVAVAALPPVGAAVDVEVEVEVEVEVAGVALEEPDALPPDGAVEVEVVAACWTVPALAEAVPASAPTTVLSASAPLWLAAVALDSAAFPAAVSVEVAPA
ncbi:MAG TPA: hypothetical protein VF457_15450, partial [Burkholderiaceae bacterium]